MNKSIIYFFFFCFYSGFILYAQPNGVDWEAYSTISVDFEKFYFYREPIGWLISTQFGELEYGNMISTLFISALLFIGTLSILKISTRNNVAISLGLLCLLMFSNFYLLLSVNGLRQGLSLGFAMFALSQAMTKDRILALIFMSLAVASHNAALILAPLVILILYPSSKLGYLFSVFIMVFSGVLNEIAEKNNNKPVTENSLSYLILIVFLFVIYFIIIGLYRKELRVHQLYNSSFIYLLFIGLSFYPMDNTFKRIIYYVAPLMILFFSFSLICLRPRAYLAMSIFVFAAISSAYSITHPSVVNNFLKL